MQEMKRKFRKKKGENRRRSGEERALLELRFFAENCQNQSEKRQDKFHFFHNPVEGEERGCVGSNGGQIGVKLKKLWPKYENGAMLSEN